MWLLIAAGDALPVIPGVAAAPVQAVAFALVLRPGTARLSGYDPLMDGAGPYRVPLPIFIAISNLVWVAELLLPMGLVLRRTRAFAAAVAITLVLSIQLGAREVSFALLFSALLALSLRWPARWKGRRQERTGAPAVTQTQKRVAIGFVVFVALWPLAHRALVARFGINPWKLAGWAIYTTPVVPTIVVRFHEEGGKLTVLDERTLPGDAAEALQRYRDARTVWGTLVAPEPLARAVFEAQPGLDHLVVATQKLTLDPDTARMTSVR